MTISRALAVLVLLLAGSTAHAAESGFAFLRLPVSARSGALGETGVSFLEGASALHQNPAGLADVHGSATSTSGWGFASEVALAHHEAFGDLRQDAVVLRLARGSQAFGAGFNTLYSEGVPETDPAGNPTGTFGLSDFLIELDYARALGGGWRAGGGVGYVTERISSHRASTWSLRAGARWDVPAVTGLSVGAALRHFGGDARFDLDGAEGEAVSLPLTVQGGASYARPLGESMRVLLSAEARAARDDDLTGLAGAELGWQSFALRAGTRLGADIGHFTAGLGVMTGAFRLDYAFMPSGEDLGNSHRFELTAAFGL